MDFTQLKQLFTDEDAVSPVIGVILMVAITVILAAVIGTFVLGLGENVQDSAPQANFQFEYNDTAMTITHTGGEDVKASEVTVQAGSDSAQAWSTGVGGTSDTISTGSDVEFGYSTTATTVNSFTESQTFDAGSGDKVRVIWTSPSGGTSNTIGQSSIPS